MKLAALLFPLAAFALDNAMRFTPVSTVTAVPMSFGKTFIDGEIPAGKFPAPYAFGNILATWQVDQVQRYPSGAVERVIMSFPLTAASLYVAEYRPHDNPCSSGNQAACDSAGLNQAGMLAFNGGTWAASATLTANPQGTTTARTFDARAVLAAGRWRYRLRGPAVTQVIVGDTSTSRVDTFGWPEHRTKILAVQVNDANATSVTVNDATGWAAISRPFEIAVGNGINGGYERMFVCFVDEGTKVLTIGNSNGASPACANTNGRNVGGTSYTYHTRNQHGTFVFLRDTALILTADLTSNATTVAVNDASAINDVFILQVGVEQIRICNKSGNNLTVGTAAWGCSANVAGRTIRGTAPGYGNGSHFWSAGTPAYDIAAMTNRWIDAPADQFKAIYPEAVLTFPAGWAGVGIRFGFEVGTWTDRMNDQYFDVSISVGGSVVAAKTAVKAAARTQLLFPTQHHALNAYWSGSTPGEVRIDHNLRHCVAAGVCLQDPDLPVTTGTISSMLNTVYQSQVGQAPAWTSANNDKCEADTLTFFDGSYKDFFGFSVRPINAPGGRDELGPITRPAAMWMYAWGHADANTSAISEMIRAQPACQAKIPYKYREHNNTRTFCNGWQYAANATDKACTGANLSVTTFGKPPSIVAYPGIGPQNQNLTRDSADYRYPVGAVSTNGFVATIGGARSHNPALAYWTALFSGDYFDEDITMHQGYVAMVQGNDYINWTPASNSGGNRSRERGPWAWPNADDGIRKPAWLRRDAFMGWKLAPPGSPEKELLGKYLERLAAMMEGMYNITNGRYYTACPGDVDTTRLYDNSPWCWGRAWPGFMSPIGNFPSEPGVGYQTAATMKANRAYAYTTSFMAGGYDLAACAQMVRGGAWMFDRICSAYAAGWITRRTAHPLAKPWILPNYQIPDRPCNPEGQDVPGCNTAATIGTNQGFLSFQNWLDSWTPSYLTDTTTAMASASDLQSGYALLLAQSACLWPDADDTPLITGRRSCAWWKANLKAQDTWPTNPHWIFAPRALPIVTVRVGDTSAHVIASTHYPVCKVSVAPLFSTQDDSGDADMVMTGQFADRIISGLAASTAYEGRLSCGSTTDRYTRVFFNFTTTAAAGGATTILISGKAPPNTASMLVEHGPSSSLGTSNTVSCTVVCELSIAAETGRAKFYRVTYRDAGTATIARSQVYRKIP